MPDLYLQRRLAADIANVGLNNVKFLPDYLDEVRDALTREDVRKLIEEGKIIIEEKRGISGSRTKVRRKNRRVKGEGRRTGSKKGGKNARSNKRDTWIARIRKMREYLRELRDSGTIDSSTYRLFYRKAKGGTFKSLADLRNALRQQGKIKG
ncbi:MAG: 50S ribosomal protein L19e [Candidatus Aramenus sp.]|nr:50S ribosomal protein L19e [Candidatus Aramenus sp.]